MVDGPDASELGITKATQESKPLKDRNIEAVRRRSPQVFRIFPYHSEPDSLPTPATHSRTPFS